MIAVIPSNGPGEVIAGRSGALRKPEAAERGLAVGRQPDADDIGRAVRRGDDAKHMLGGAGPAYAICATLAPLRRRGDGPATSGRQRGALADPDGRAHPSDRPPHLVVGRDRRRPRGPGPADWHATPSLAHPGRARRDLVSHVVWWGHGLGSQPSSGGGGGAGPAGGGGGPPPPPR